jgi:lactoylglutathione lyase
MLGLWSVGTAPLGLNLHIALEVSAINDLLDAPKRLKDQGIVPLSFFGKESMEPSVIGWMPAAAVYFRDPDGHLIEYLTILDDRERKHDLGIVNWSEWIANDK